MNRLAKRSLIISTNVDGFSLANHSQFTKFVKLSHNNFLTTQLASSQPYGLVYMSSAVVYNFIHNLTAVAMAFTSAETANHRYLPSRDSYASQKVHPLIQLCMSGPNKAKYFCSNSQIFFGSLELNFLYYLDHIETEPPIFVVSN